MMIGCTGKAGDRRSLIDLLCSAVCMVCRGLERDDIASFFFHLLQLSGYIAEIHYAKHKTRPDVTDVAWSVCLSVCWSRV